MSSRRKSFSQFRKKMFRNRSKSAEVCVKSSAKDRARAEHFAIEYDLANVCSHLDALMNAARFGNVDLLYKLYVHHVDLKMMDEVGNTAIHVAVMNNQQKIVRMLIVLCAPFRLWKQQNNNGLTAMDLCTDAKIRDDLMSLERPPTKPPADAVFDIDAHTNNFLVDSKKQWEPNDRVLLALDGGGIRALITTQMLIHIDALLDGTLVEKVDDMAGTSCGGCIALLLSTYNRNIEETRRLLLDMREQVFSKNQGKAMWPKYNAAGMEYVAKHITSWEDSKMNIIKRHRTMVTVADTRMVPTQLHLFRSWCPNMPEEAREHYKFFDPSKVELWKALRCTTAAPFFFESFNGLSDGGLIANNPTLALMSDFFVTNKLEKAFATSDAEREIKGNWKIGCVISLGTGIFPTEKIDGIDLSLPNMKNPLNFAKSFYKAISSTKNMLHVLVKECTASNGQPVKYAKEWCHSIGAPYFRFSPLLSQGIALDELDLGKIMHVMWETEQYVALNRPTLEKLANFLKSKPKREGFEEEDSEKTNNTTTTTKTTTMDTTTVTESNTETF